MTNWGTLHALVRYLMPHKIDRGSRRREGPAKGTVEGRRPNRMTLQHLLKNPLYAGAYAYGRRQGEARNKPPGRPRTGRVTRPRHAYHVVLQERLPAYITWAQYERHRARLEPGTYLLTNADRYIYGLPSHVKVKAGQTNYFRLTCR